MHCDARTKIYRLEWWRLVVGEGGSELVEDNLVIISWSLAIGYRRPVDIDLLIYGLQLFNGVCEFWTYGLY